MDYLEIILQVLTIAILAAYAIILIKSRLNPKIVKWAAIIITLAGSCVFMYGYQAEGYCEGWVILFLRGLIAAAKMFLYDNSVFEALNAQKESPYFLNAFILVYYAAILTSLSAIILLFGKRVTTFFALAFNKKKFRHVFFGINRNSETIAKGIKNEEIAFVEFPGEDEEELSVTTLINSMAKDDHSNSFLSSGKITLLRARRKLAQRDSGDGVLEEIGLGRLQKRIDKNTSFYLLSDDGEKNLQDLLILVSDERIRHNTIHACVKREGLAQTFHGVLGKTGAHLIYPSSLAVVDLMKSPDCHPANMMSIDTNEDGSSNGTVSGEFNALIVGFGETGQAATKFIYEFASAIRKDGTPLPVHIYINDERLDRLQGHFMFNCPEMEHDDIVTYENNGLDSGLFWKTLLSRLDSLNYVEISMGNDTANLDLACTIYGYAEKKRKNGFNNFRIFVRKKNTPSYESKLVKRLNEKAGQEVIRCFGEHDKVFTPEMIISKDLSGINMSATSLAGKLKARYDEIAGVKPEEAVSGTPMTYHEKRRLRKDTHQFISRANHISSMLALCGWDTNVSPETLENLAMCEHLRYSRYLKAHGYSFDKEDDDVMKTNHQLVPWAELSEEDKQYHRNMVRATLSISE